MTQGSSRLAPSLLTSLLVAMLVGGADATGQEEDALTVPVPREGDTIVMEEITTRFADDGPVVTTVTTTIEWDGPLRWALDGFGVERLVYPAQRTFACEGLKFCPRPETRMVEVGTNHVVSVTGDSWTGGGWMWIGLGVYHVEQSNLRGDVGTFYGPRWSLQEALHGTTIQTGEVVVRALPASPARPHEVRVALFEALGWQEHEGERLFRVAAQDPTSFVRDLDLWFDAARSLPALVTASWELFGDRYARETRIAGVQVGAGAPLTDPAYIPPPAGGVREDAAFVPFTLDGPAEDMLTSVPLALALSTAKTDARLDAWLEAHPGAYLRSAMGYEISWQGRVGWFLAFGDGLATAEVRLLGPYTAGLPSPAIVVEDFAEWPDAPHAFAADVVGRPVACTSEAWRVAQAAVEEALDGAAHPDRLASFVVRGSGPVATVECSVWSERYASDQVDVHELDLSLTGDLFLRHTEGNAKATADVDGHTGAIAFAGNGRTEQRYVTYGALN